MTKRAIISDIIRQNANYLAKLFIEKDYEVHGIKRRA